MDIEKSFPPAEAFIDAEQLASPDDREPNCLNCDTPLTGPYCSQCGQRRLPHRQTLTDLFSNFIASFISFESKFLKTGKLLLLHPGRLPIDYNAGKRERHYHPARLYVFISFVFFLLVSIIPDEKEKGVNSSTSDTTQFKIHDLDKALGNLKTREQYDSAQLARPADKRDNFFKRKIRQRELELHQRYEGHWQDFNTEYASNYLENVPRVFFFLLPIFALILKMLYIRKDYYYSEHLVFSIYYYNFFFLAGSLIMLLDLVPYTKWINVALVLWIGIYLLLAMKRVYRQGWFKTIFKFGTFTFIFCLFIGIALFVNLIISVMLL